MWRATASASALGLEIIGVLAVGWLGGKWVDGKLGTEPWFFGIGLVAGVGAAIKALHRVTKAYKKSLQDDVPPTDDRKP
jgi:ATP synthase protein I